MNRWITEWLTKVLITNVQDGETNLICITFRRIQEKYDGYSCWNKVEIETLSLKLIFYWRSLSRPSTFSLHKNDDNMSQSFCLLSMCYYFYDDIIESSILSSQLCVALWCKFFKKIISIFLMLWPLVSLKLLMIFMCALQSSLFFC